MVEKREAMIPGRAFVAPTQAAAKKSVAAPAKKSAAAPV